MSNVTIHDQIVANAANYVVIDDGAFRYPMARVDMGGVSRDDLSAMTGDEYSAWCSDHPADFRVGDLYSDALMQLIDDLLEADADLWDVTKPVGYR